MNICKGVSLALIVSFILFFSTGADAVENAPKISDREIIESLVRLEEGIRANAKAIEANRRAIEANRRAIEANREMIVSLRDDMNAEMKSMRDDMNAEMKSMRDDINAEMKSMRDEILGFLMWGFGLLFTGMLILVGFILWDRRSTISPVKDEINELREKRVERAITAMKKMAEGDPRFAEALRSVGLL